jgi:hypothetical protein
LKAVKALVIGHRPTGGRRDSHRTGPTPRALNRGNPMPNHLQALEAAFDGPIPRTRHHNARRHTATPRSTFRARVRITSLKPGFVVPAMAAVLVEAFRTRDTATEADLHLAGFDATTITRHGPAAKHAALAALADAGIEVPGAA